MQLLVRSQTPELTIDLADLMKYPLTLVPFSIGTADGCFAKTDKSKGLTYLLDKTDSVNVAPQDETVLLIEDGNALFHSIKKIPGNFRQISEKLFSMTSQKVDVIFSTDMYKEDSVKSMEKNRRGSSEKLLLQGENTKKPADWKAFLTNEDNKKQLVHVLLNAWDNDAYAKKLQGRKVVLICEGDAYCYTSDDGIKTERTPLDGLKSTQEETDTRIILYCLYAQDQGYKIVHVRTPDSDLLRELEEYTCAMYGNSRFTSVDELRLFKLKEKCEGKPTTAMRNMDMSTLPPCRKCLIQHVRRVNYQLSILKNSHKAQPNIPVASERHGWTRVKWCSGAIMD